MDGDVPEGLQGLLPIYRLLAPRPLAGSTQSATIPPMNVPIPDGIYTQWHERPGWTARLVCRGRVEATVRHWRLGALAMAQDPRAAIHPTGLDVELEGALLAQAQAFFAVSDSVPITWHPRG